MATMTRALQSITLARQTFTTSSLAPTRASTPLQRLGTQLGLRNSTKAPPISPSRSTHTSLLPARTTVLPLVRGAWPRCPGSGSTKTRNGLFRTKKRNFGWSWPRQASNFGAGGHVEETLSLSARLRKLSREYGWAAVGVYLGLSVLDFPFCFLLVKWAGTERIAAIEHWVISILKNAIPDSVQQRWYEWRVAVKGEKEQLGDIHVSQDIEKIGWGVEEAQQRSKTDASIATQLALAYAIHKSFIFIRVPLTAAVTPKVVKLLRSWGWRIGQRKPKIKR